MKGTYPLFGLLLCIAPCIYTGCTSPENASPPPPNIVIILADDMGYGDIQHYNPQSTVPTPNLNRLCEEGAVFTDAHTPSAVCTPTRYGLMTGRYAWRSRLKSGVLSGYSPTLIEADRQTLAHVLTQAGYETGVVGKWHLGLDWPWVADSLPKGGDNLLFIPEPNAIDYTQPLKKGAKENGFAYSFLVPGSLDMGPYVFVENNQALNPPVADSLFPGRGFPAYIRKGEVAPGFTFDQVLQHLGDKATDFIANKAKGDKPFFLYMPLTGPHKPALPNPAFVGKSGLGPYTDLVMEVDHTVGRIMAALEKAGVAENTLLLYTSDNGSYMFRLEADQADHVQDSTVQGYAAAHHKANADWRGTKADIWEAGHRVPFIVRYPGQVQAGTRIDQTICLTDVLATLCEWTGQSFDAAQAEDSYSFLPLLRGAPVDRPAVVHHSVAGMFSLRNGDMKLVFGNGSGGRQQPTGKKFEKPYQLFDLKKDPGETQDLAGDPAYAAQLEELTAAFREILMQREGHGVNLEAL